MAGPPALRAGNATGPAAAADGGSHQSTILLVVTVVASTVLIVALGIYTFRRIGRGGAGLGAGADSPAHKALSSPVVQASSLPGYGAPASPAAYQQPYYQQQVLLRQQQEKLRLQHEQTMFYQQQGSERELQLYHFSLSSQLPTQQQAQQQQMQMQMEQQKQQQRQQQKQQQHSSAVSASTYYESGRSNMRAQSRPVKVSSFSHSSFLEKGDVSSPSSSPLSAKFTPSLPQPGSRREQQRAKIAEAAKMQNGANLRFQKPSRILGRTTRFAKLFEFV